MRIRSWINSIVFLITIISLLSGALVFTIKPVQAATYTGQDLAYAILANTSAYITSSYYDTDKFDDSQSIILSSHGAMIPTNGDDFIILSTGTAGASIVTTDQLNPGEERGTWFRTKYSTPRDEVIFTMDLKVPKDMHTLCYDFQFFSTEYPEYIGSQYNDIFTVTVESPSKGTSTYTCDVNSGDFEDMIDITDTGFDIFATSGNPNNVDYVDTTPRVDGADAGATGVIQVGGTTHPISPLEKITVTFHITDTGDNQFDSAVFIDNVFFSGRARTDILSYKTVNDLTQPPYEANDTIQYSVTISNVGNLNLANDIDSNEFEDPIPEYTEYINGTVTATRGVVIYEEATNKIIWNGDIPKETSVIITYNVKINETVGNGTTISNQGTVYYDSDEDEQNDAIEYTDDTKSDDGIDLDGDGDTDDDDPTDIVVVKFVPPSQVTEDFSDDLNGGTASQTYLGRTWFYTDDENLGNNFEVSSSYHYSTPKSFKTQIRNCAGIQTWYYNLTEIESDIDWWESMFACGNASEYSDLYVTFKDKNGYEIAELKFEYEHAGTQMPLDWLVKMYYYDPTIGWMRLETNYTGWYLYNGWYKIRIEKNQQSNLVYSLYQGSSELVDQKTGIKFPHTFTDIATIEFSSTEDPLQCPMFIWDEHKVGLIN